MKNTKVAAICILLPLLAILCGCSSNDSGSSAAAPGVTGGSQVYITPAGEHYTSAGVLASDQPVQVSAPAGSVGNSLAGGPIGNGSYRGPIGNRPPTGAPKNM